MRIGLKVEILREKHAIRLLSQVSRLSVKGAGVEQREPQNFTILSSLQFMAVQCCYF